MSARSFAATFAWTMSARVCTAAWANSFARFVASSAVDARAVTASTLLWPRGVTLTAASTPPSDQPWPIFAAVREAARGESRSAAAVCTVRAGSSVSMTTPVPVKVGSAGPSGLTRTDALAS